MANRELLNRFKSKSRIWVDGVPDQCRASRLTRLNEGRCPIHDKPLLQSDVWYRPRNGQRYTFVSCMHPQCRLEAVCSATYDEFTLVPDWRFLLEQNDAGCGDLVIFPRVAATSKANSDELDTTIE